MTILKELRIKRTAVSLLVTTLSVVAAWLYCIWVFGPHWQDLAVFAKVLLLAVLGSGAFGVLMNWRRVYVFGEKSVSVRRLLGWRHETLPSRIAITRTGENNEWVTIVDSDNDNAPVMSVPNGMAPQLLERLRDFYSQWFSTVKLDFKLTLAPGLPEAEIRRELKNAAPWLEDAGLDLHLESPDNVFRIDCDSEHSAISVKATDTNVDWKAQVKLVNHLVSEFADAGFRVEVEATYSDLLAG